MISKLGIPYFYLTQATSSYRPVTTFTFTTIHNIMYYLSINQASIRRENTTVFMIMKINLRRHRHRHHHNRYLYHRHQIHHHHITRKNKPREHKDSEGGRRRSKNLPTSSQGLFLKKKMGGPFFKAKPVGTRLKTDLTISKTARCTP